MGYLAALTPESLDDLVYKKVSVTGQRFGTRRSDVPLHVCTHAHYTAAQVVNMLRQAGVTVPDPDPINWLRAQQGQEHGPQ